MRITITAAWLASRACFPEHVELFRATWGDSVELTRGELLRAAETGVFLVEWLAEHVLQGDVAKAARFRSLFRQAKCRLLIASQPEHVAIQSAAAHALADVLGLPGQTSGQSVELTRAELLATASTGVRVEWLAEHVLQGDGSEVARFRALLAEATRALYAAASRDISRELEPHIAECQAAVAASQGRHKRSTGQHWVDGDDWAAHEREIAPALAKLRAAEDRLRPRADDIGRQRGAANALADVLGLP